MYSAMTLGKRAESEAVGNIYDAFSRDYDLLQGELSKTTWDQGIIAEIRATFRREGRVFDAGAGTGIGARRLKALGNFHITSCDRNRLMLVQAKNVSDEMLHAELASIPPLAAKFDFIVSGFDTLNYLQANELGRFFRWSHQHLAGDGCLIFDYSSPQLLRDSWKSKSYVTRVGKLTLAWNHQFNESHQRAEIALTCLRNGEIVWVEKHHQYSLELSDICALACANKLVVQRVRNLVDSNFTPESPTHLYVVTPRMN